MFKANYSPVNNKSHNSIYISNKDILYKTLGHKFKRHAHSMAPKLPITYMCLVGFIFLLFSLIYLQ